MKKLCTFVLLLIMSISSIGCNEKENNKIQLKSENEIEQSEANENRADKDKTPQDMVNPDKSDYSIYSGNWVKEELLMADYKYGISVKLNANKDGDVTGNIFSSTENLTHIAQLDISGQIKDNKLSYDFEEDGWGHSGKVEIDFKENSIVLNIKYTKANSESNLWGIGEGSFPLIKDTTPVKRTLKNLKYGGLSVIENQSFDTKLDNYGDVKFISGVKREDASEIPVFYIADKSENILYKLPAFYGNDKGHLKEINCVAFIDLNGDNLKDILIIGKFVNFSTEIDIASIYFQNGNEFKNNETLDEKVNNSANNKNMESVVNFVKGL